jgi:choline kinase
MASNSSSRLSLVSQSSMEDGESYFPPKSGHEHEEHHHHHEKLLSQVAEWLQAEEAKRAARRARKCGEVEKNKENENKQQRPRTGSDSSAVSLERLQRILEDNMSTFGMENPLDGPRKHVQRRRSSARKLGGFASSDTEYQDGDIVVPSCDVVLDNSKTTSFTGGGASVESSDMTVTMSTSRRAEKKKAW